MTNFLKETTVLDIFVRNTDHIARPKEKNVSDLLL